MDEKFIQLGISTPVKLKNAEELQQLINKASNLNTQLIETLQQIEQFELKT